MKKLLVATRRHTNGWTSAVEGADSNSILFGIAFTSTGVSLTGSADNYYIGGHHDFARRLEKAMKAADEAVMRLAGHRQCDCPPWPEVETWSQPSDVVSD